MATDFKQDIGHRSGTSLSDSWGRIDSSLDVEEILTPLPLDSERNEDHLLRVNRIIYGGASSKPIRAPHHLRELAELHPLPEQSREQDRQQKERQTRPNRLRGPVEPHPRGLHGQGEARPDRLHGLEEPRPNRVHGQGKSRLQAKSPEIFHMDGFLFSPTQTPTPKSDEASVITSGSENELAFRNDSRASKLENNCQSTQKDYTPKSAKNANFQAPGQDKPSRVSSAQSKPAGVEPGFPKVMYPSSHLIPKAENKPAEARVGNLHAPNNGHLHPRSGQNESEFVTKRDRNEAPDKERRVYAEAGSNTVDKRTHATGGHYTENPAEGRFSSISVVDREIQTATPPVDVGVQTTSRADDSATHHTLPHHHHHHLHQEHDYQRHQQSVYPNNFPSATAPRDHAPGHVSADVVLLHSSAAIHEDSKILHADNRKRSKGEDRKSGPPAGITGDKNETNKMFKYSSGESTEYSTGPPADSQGQGTYWDTSLQSGDTGQQHDMVVHPLVRAATGTVNNAGGRTRKGVTRIPGQERSRVIDPDTSGIDSRGINPGGLSDTPSGAAEPDNGSTAANNSNQDRTANSLAPSITHSQRRHHDHASRLESQTSPDRQKSKIVPDHGSREPLNAAHGHNNNGAGGNITENVHNNNPSLSTVSGGALKGTNEAPPLHATPVEIISRGGGGRYESADVFSARSDFEPHRQHNLPLSSTARGDIPLSSAADRDLSQSSAVRKELPFSSTGRKGRGRSGRRKEGVSVTVPTRPLQGSRQGNNGDRHEPQLQNLETRDSLRIVANSGAKGGSYKATAVTFQEDAKERGKALSVQEDSKERKGKHSADSYHQYSKKSEEPKETTQDIKEENTPSFPETRQMFRGNHRHHLRADGDLSWDYSPDECKRLSPSPRHKDRESTTPSSKFVKDGSHSHLSHRKEYLDDINDNEKQRLGQSNGGRDEILRNGGDRNATHSLGVTGEDYDELRQSLRELSAKIQLKKMEEKGVFDTEKKQKHGSKLPQPRKEHPQDPVDRGGNRGPAHEANQRGTNGHKHPSKTNHSYPRSDDGLGRNGDALGRNGDVLSKNGSVSRDPDSGIADEDDDWMTSMDDVDIEASYEGGDKYVFYLQTDEGELVGPLRFDVEDIQMGLPTADGAGINNGNGLRNRQTGSHGLNEFSSRSHSVLTVTIDSETQPDTEDENLYVTKRGKLSFVDLAGSEKVKDASGSFGGPGILESNSINKSLLVLGNCISHLGDAKRRQGHIPYRDSKLTKLLSDSLAGNGITLMIACINPSSSNITETMNTLRYASRAKKIKTKPTVKMDPRENLILSLKREMKVLRNENHYLRQQLDFPAKPKGQLQKENDEKFMKFMQEQQQKESGLYEMLQEYMVENENLRAENSEMHSMRDRIRREQQLLYRENEKLMKRLEEMEKVVSQNPAIWAMSQHKRTDGYGQYDLVSPRGSPIASGYHSGHSQKGHPPVAGSPPGSRGKGPPGPMRPPHRLPDPVMRPAQRPVEMVENGATYASNGYTSPRAGPRQTSPTRQMERKASQISTTDAIHSMNEKLKKEVMQLEGQIRHHEYAHERSQDMTGTRSTHGNGVR